MIYLKTFNKYLGIMRFTKTSKEFLMVQQFYSPAFIEKYQNERLHKAKKKTSCPENDKKLLDLEKKMWKIHTGKLKFKFSALPTEIKAYVNSNIIENKNANHRLKLKYKHSLNISHKPQDMEELFGKELWE